MKALAFKRVRNLLGLILLIAVVLVACSRGEDKPSPSASDNPGGSPAQSQTPAKKTEIQYWYWLDDSANNIIEQLIQEFNSANDDIQVVGRLIPFNDFQQTLINSVASDDAPDVSKFKDWWIGQFVDSGLLEPLDEYTKTWEHASDIDEVFWKTGKTVDPNSPVYMMPHQYITFYLYYRKDLFEEAGLQPPKTLDDFLQAAIALTDPAKQQYGFAYRGGGGGQDQWYAFMLANGARMVDEQGNIIINNEDGVRANQWYTDLYKVHKVTPPTAMTDSYAQIMAGFQAGTTAMMAHHIGSYETLYAALGDKLGVVPMPQRDPDNPATMGTMTGNVIFKSSKNKEAAWRFLSWLSGPEATDKLSQSTNGQLPVLNSLVSQPQYQKNEGWKIAIESEKFAHVWPPLKGVGAIAGHVWKDNSDLELIGEITSQQNMDAIAAALKE